MSDQSDLYRIVEAQLRATVPELIFSDVLAYSLPDVYDENLTLAALLTHWRKRGLSHRMIAHVLATLTGEAVSHETVRRWLNNQQGAQQ